MASTGVQTETQLWLSGCDTIEEMVEQIIRHAEYRYETRRPRLKKLVISRNPHRSDKKILEDLAGVKLVHVRKLEKELLTACKECMTARGSLPHISSPKLKVRVKTHNCRIQRVLLTIT